MRHLSFGDISTSRVWFSIERKPLAWWRWWLSFKPTYNGTIVGLHIGLPFLCVIGHVRSK